MKKINLFKIVMLSLLVVLALTWIVPASSFDGRTLTGIAITPVPLLSVFSNIFASLSVSYFPQMAIFILAVGGFYGILNITDAYSNLVQKVAKHAKKRAKIFIVATTVLFALLASFVSFPFALFVFVPMFVTVILAMGYDKLTALAATVGAIAVGMIGTLYGYSLAGEINTTLGLNMSNAIFARVALFNIGVCLLSFYIVGRADKVSAKEKEESKEYDTMYVEAEKSKKGTVAISITLATTFVLFVLGFVTWSSTFGIKVFESFNTWFLGLKLFKFPLMGNIFGKFSAFGSWSFIDITVVLIIATIVMAVIYRIKLNEYLIAFFEGVKKLLPTSAIILLALSVLIVSNANTYQSIVGITPAFFDFFLSLTDKFSLLALIIPTLLSAVINVDAHYFVQFGLEIVNASVANESVNPVIGLLFQTMYGFAALFAPTSLILLAGLSYLEVSYTKWIKYIAMFLLQIFAVIMAVLIIVKFII